MATAVLCEVDAISTMDTSNVIDKSKVGCTLSDTRDSIILHMQVKKKSVYFDCKKEAKDWFLGR